MATIKTGLSPTLSITTENLGGPGPIAFEETQVDNTLSEKHNEIIDYIRLRLADQIVDVELDLEHYQLAIKQAIIKYRQRAQNSQEESWAFLDLLPNVQEYILPREIITVRSVFRRGIGSVTGTTASQFEPFASGYLNTYMLVAGRVGGLVNYELFTQYQELAMKMFGGYMDFIWNPATRKLTLVRKIPENGVNYFRLESLTADGTAVGSVITIRTTTAMDVKVGDPVYIANCKIVGWNGNYSVQTVDPTTRTITVSAVNPLGSTEVVTYDLSSVRISSSVTDVPAETILLRTYNTKPEIMLLNDHLIFPWLQEYAYSFAKRIVGEGRSKFTQIAGPQGGSSLNGDALKTEAQAEMDKLEEELKTYVDGSTPLTWVIG